MISILMTKKIARMKKTKSNMMKEMKKMKRTMRVGHKLIKINILSRDSTTNSKMTKMAMTVKKGIKSMRCPSVTSITDSNFKSKVVMVLKTQMKKIKMIKMKMNKMKMKMNKMKMTKMMKMTMIRKLEK